METQVLTDKEIEMKTTQEPGHRVLKNQRKPTRISNANC